MPAPTETHTQALKRKFDELQEEKSVYEELYRLLRSIPEKDAIDVVRRLRTDGDVATVIRQVKEGCLLLQLALTPETRLRYTFPYVAEMPARVQVADNQYLQSPVYETVFAIGNPSPPSMEELMTRYQGVYLRPYHAAEVVDARFSKIRASRWTTVISDDGLFRKVLQAYLLHEYTTFAFFHKDCFLDDLAKGRTRFCSLLMVNTILAIGCVSRLVLSNLCAVEIG